MVQMLRRVLRRAEARGVARMFDRGLDRVVARGYLALRDAARERARAQELREHLMRLVPALASQLTNLTSPEPTVVHTDAAGFIVDPNPAAAQWLNVPSHRLVGMELLHFVGRRDTGTFRGIVKGLGYGRTRRAVTVRFRPRQGRQEVVHASVEKVAPNRFAWTLRPVPSAKTPSKVQASAPARGLLRQPA